MIISEKYEALREQARLLGDMFSLMLARAALLERRYDPAQPRAPAGQPNGGQWVGEGGGADIGGGGDQAQVLLAGELEKLDPKTSISQFIADNCVGKIHRE